MTTTNTVMLSYPNKSTRNFLEVNSSANLYTFQLCRNGDPSEFNNQEDGFIMNYTDLNLTFYSSEDPKDPIPKQDSHLLDLLLLLTHSALEMMI